MKAFRLFSFIGHFDRFLAGPTGGLAYHLAAAKYRESLWRPFVNDVERWLVQDWGPSLEANRMRELIIFGPSAGWSLSEKFLGRFTKVICVEPDPLARLLFRWRFRKIKNLEFETRSDLLPWFAKDRSPERLGQEFEAFLRHHPQAAILFSNLLGQIQLLMEKPNVSFNERSQRALLAALKNREWASYHDVVSTGLTPKYAPETLIKDVNLNDLIEMNFELAPGRPVTDHETQWLGSEQTSIWQIRPGVYHLVGFTYAGEFCGLPDSSKSRVKSFQKPASQIAHEIK